MIYGTISQNKATIQ